MPASGVDLSALMDYQRFLARTAKSSPTPNNLTPSESHCNPSHEVSPNCFPPIRNRVHLHRHLESLWPLHLSGMRLRLTRSTSLHRTYVFVPREKEG